MPHGAQPAAQRRLGRAFELRQVHKRYQAIVAGCMAPRPPHLWNTIDLPIAADWERRPLRVIDPVLGKPSLTRWRVLAHHPDVDTTRVELEPMTGAHTSCGYTLRLWAIPFWAMHCMPMPQPMCVRRGYCCTQPD